MGYQTWHKLEIRDSNDKTVENMTEIISELRGYNGDAEFALSPDGEGNEHCKWYSAIDDIASFSKFYPDLMFILCGEGEFNEDIWKAYIQNGKSKTLMAEIVFPEFKGFDD